MPQNTQKGFTLLELLVVVAIIGALAGIAIPQYNSYREKTEKAAVLSDCRTLYRGFVLYYLEWNAFPLTVDEEGVPGTGLNVTTLYPLTDPTEIGGGALGVDVPRFMSNIDGGQAELYESPGADDQYFYLVLPWKKNPALKFIIAQSDLVEYADGTPVDGGNWLDGVFISVAGDLQ